MKYIIHSQNINKFIVMIQKVPFSFTASTSTRGMLETLRLIVEKDGFMGLYRGMGPNFIKLVPTVTVSYIVYEQTLRSLGVF